MATPLTDGINALIRYANEATGSTTDTTLSDAVESLVAGYGQGGGAETVTVTATATNALQCMKNIVKAVDSETFYAAIITGKQKSEWVADQFLCGIIQGIYHAGIGLRYRNSNIGSCGISTNFDAKVEIGDVFTILKIPYS